MISLDEIWTARQQLRDWLQAGEYEKLTQFFSVAEKNWQSNKDDPLYPLISQYTFLFTPLLFSDETIALSLTAWHQSQPQSSYPCEMLAQRWLEIAAKARGTHAADHVTANQWIRAKISSDLMFYWAAKALSLNSTTPTMYYHLLVATGHFQEPEWFHQAHEPVHFDLAAYTPEAITFARSLGGLPLSEAPVFTGLPVANEVETRNPLIYWLNRALECDADNMPIREQFIHYLYPRWYGDEEHASLDAFLASDYCAPLPETRRNKLYSVKLLDKLANPQHWPEKSKIGKVRKFDELCQQLLTLDVSEEDKASLHYTYLNICTHFLLDDDNNFYAESPRFARHIYDSIHFILHSNAWRLLVEQEGALLFWLLTVLCHKEYQLSDDKALLKRYFDLTGARCESAMEMLFSVYLRLFPLQDIQLPGPVEPWIARLLQTEDRLPIELLNTTLNRLCFFQQKAQAQAFLTQLGERDFAPALLLLSEIYAGMDPVAAENLQLTPSQEKSAVALERACRTHSPEALFRKSRILEMQSGREALEERLTLLAEATAKGHALAQYDYACALFWSLELAHQKLAVEEICPQVLLGARVDSEKLAYIAYLYAFGLYNRRGGLRRNCYLMVYWLSYATQLAPGEMHYQKMAVCHSRKYRGFLVLWLFAKMAKKKAPAWQLNLLESLGMKED
ncbi:DUF4034 domain-containing protein [Kosakonia sp.]|uniref:DUF4034 domain-containing protein n=1 Tax=Kosakonia sp. TaxID=1916651 RepID=UPI00289EB294|nr:DUF4034 domain-containing protein [Kosakonia sp.]